MQISKLRPFTLLITISILWTVASVSAKPLVETNVDTALAHLKKYVPVLKNNRGQRWPLLIWHGPLMDKRMMKAWGKRGLASLCVGRYWHIDAPQPKSIKKILPYLQWEQSHHQPVIVLAQGWMHTPYDNSKGRSNHVPPAKQASAKHKDVYADYACPSVFYNKKRMKKYRQGYKKIARTIKQAGITPTAVIIDFESGALFRNAGDRAKHVVKSVKAARHCSRCVNQFGAKALSSLSGYQQVVNEARAYATRVNYVNPIHKIFPDVYTGNYFAWPIARSIERNPKRYQGRYPAYGYVNSGMNVLQPNCYYVPGWGGKYFLHNPRAKTRDMVGWNIFWFCLDKFSRAAQVMRPGEKLVPWIGWLLFRENQQKFYANRPVPYFSAYREMVIQSMMRGVETFCIFTPNLLTDQFIDGFPKEKRLHNLGPFLFNVLPVQQAYDRMLAFNNILRNGKVLNYKVPGKYLHPKAIWSGLATTDKALIRTVAFGPETMKTIKVFNQEFTLPFRHKGQFFWVYPDGQVQKIAHKNSALN